MGVMSESVVKELNNALERYQNFPCGGNATISCLKCALAKKVSLVDPEASEERVVQFSLCDLIGVVNDEFEDIIENLETHRSNGSLEQ
ncbi:hypothetical protein [Candidatus Borrarchaeum sp.]|uniref:hypothetical protein n=1 Tax=Candidatus Borrarchaeum sp. TaxID=2846742 RepID=UPI00257E1B97|nr:hypothetical protein [Candidatus Borrarchaeum sp.]